MSNRTTMFRKSCSRLRLLFTISCPSWLSGFLLCTAALLGTGKNTYTHTDTHKHIFTCSDCALSYVLHYFMTWHSMKHLLRNDHGELHVSSPRNTAKEQASVVWVYPCVTMAHTVCPIGLWDYARRLHNVPGIWTHMFLCMFVACKRGLTNVLIKMYCIACFHVQ